LAERAGVAFATVHRIEVGAMSPTVALLEKLANALDIEVRDFFPLKRKPRPNRRSK
jgi:transcriptional regulator with XRE-family HTH domain